MKRLLSIFAAVLLLAALFLVASAESEPHLIWDNADLLTSQEEMQLFSCLNRVGGGSDAVVVTINSLDGKSAQAYAENFWDTHYYRDPGVLLLVCMDERQWWISTNGTYTGIITDAVIDALADDFLPSLSAGNYYDAFVIFAEGCKVETDAYRHGSADAQSGDQVVTFLICLGIGLVLALIVVGILASQLKSVRSRNSAGSYICDGSMQVTHSRDIFLYQNTTRRAKPQNNGSGGGGGGHSRGGRGGSF